MVGFHLAEAQRHARRGARTRQQALADVYRRDDGAWGIGDPNALRPELLLSDVIPE